MIEHARLNALFLAQHGVVATRQLRAVGVTWEAQRSRVRSGAWAMVGHNVVELRGAPHSWLYSAATKVLAAGPLALLAAQSAARIHGLDGFARDEHVTLTLPRSERRPRLDDVDVRWTAGLGRSDRFLVNGLPVTTMPLTLVHLAAHPRAEQALDSAMRLRHSPLWLRGVFDDHAKRGTRGATTMLDLLADRVGKRLPRSWFQRLAKRALVELQLDLVDEWPVRDPSGRVVAELDLADVDRRIGVECQSIDFHTAPTDRFNDLMRIRRLRQLGWRIVEVWWRDLDDMNSVLADLRIAIADR